MRDTSPRMLENLDGDPFRPLSDLTRGVAATLAGVLIGSTATLVFVLWGWSASSVPGAIAFFIPGCIATAIACWRRLVEMVGVPGFPWGTVAVIATVPAIVSAALWGFVMIVVATAPFETKLFMAMLPGTLILIVGFVVGVFAIAAWTLLVRSVLSRS
jgi:hypothetical protein